MFPAFVASGTEICELMGGNRDLIRKPKSRDSSHWNLALLFTASTEYVIAAWQDLRQLEFPFQLIEEL